MTKKVAMAQIKKKPFFILVFFLFVYGELLVNIQYLMNNACMEEV